jgi:hypothetical protein
MLTLCLDLQLLLAQSRAQISWMIAYGLVAVRSSAHTHFIAKAAPRAAKAVK